MKKLQITMIAMLCVIIVFLCGILAVGMNRKSYYGCHGHMGKYSLVQEAEFSDVESLYAEYGKNPEDIYFYEGTSDKVVIKEYMNFEPKEGELSSFQQNGGELFLRGSKWNSDFSISFRNAYIEIYLPAAVLRIYRQRRSAAILPQNVILRRKGIFL